MTGPGHGVPVSGLSDTDGQAGGPFSKRVEAFLSDLHMGASAFLTTSCTAALEMSGILARISPGDVVVVPSFGFVTTALAFVRAQARIRFADIDPDTLGLSAETVEPCLDDRVKAVVPIHYAGRPADPKGLRSLCTAYRTTLIEDNAHGLFGSFEGIPLGSFGAMSTLSFHATKNISCGEGGALIVNDASLIERAKVVYEKGTDRAAFLEGNRDKYTWRDLGSSFGMSDYLAAILERRLAVADQIQSRRRNAVAAYEEVLEPHQDLGYRLASHLPGAVPAYHIYFVILDDPGRRHQVLLDLRAQGVAASFHYVPLHDTPGGMRWADGQRGCPVTERVAASIVRLPLSDAVTPEAARANADCFLKAIST